MSVVNLSDIFTGSAQAFHFLNLLTALVFFPLWWQFFLLGWVMLFLWLDHDFYPSGPLCFFFLRNINLSVLPVSKFGFLVFLPLNFVGSLYGLDAHNPSSDIRFINISSHSEVVSSLWGWCPLLSRCCWVWWSLVYAFLSPVLWRRVSQISCPSQCPGVLPWILLWFLIFHSTHEFILKSN